MVSSKSLIGEEKAGDRRRRTDGGQEQNSKYEFSNVQKQITVG
jgi:hypothetical protein